MLEIIQSSYLYLKFLLDQIILAPSLTLGLVFYIVFSLTEINFPIEKNHTLRNRVKNIIYTGANFFGGFIITGFLLYLIPHETSERTFISVPNSLFIAVCYLFTADFIFYWYHRALHQFSFLWPIHELHHSDSQLNSSSAFRAFYLETPLYALVVTEPTLYFFGVDYLALTMFSCFYTIWVQFGHVNIPFSFGIFTNIFCGPQVHRIHHSKFSEHRNKNFAQFFPVYDIIFGTFYHPKQNEFPPTGTSQLDSNAPIIKVFVRPFKIWASLITKRLKFR